MRREDFAVESEPNLDVSDSMNVLDLSKATAICGGVAFLFYSFPILGQILVIALLTLLWLSYARKTLRTLRRKKLA